MAVLHLLIYYPPDIGASGYLPVRERTHTDKQVRIYSLGQFDVGFS